MSNLVFLGRAALLARPLQSSSFIMWIEALIGWLSIVLLVVGSGLLGAMVSLWWQHSPRGRALRQELRRGNQAPWGMSAHLPQRLYIRPLLMKDRRT